MKQRQILIPTSQKQEYDKTYTSEAKRNCTILKMEGRTQQEEKDGFPIARGQTPGELEADPTR